MAVLNKVVTTAAQIASSAERTPKIIKSVIDAAAENLGAGDVVVAFFIPPFHRVLGVALEVLTVEGGVATADVGVFSNAGVTAVDADGFLDGADCNAATLVHSASTAADLAAKGYLAGADGAYLCLTSVAAMDAAKISLKAELQNWG